MNAPESAFSDRRADNPLVCAVVDNTDTVRVLVARMEALEKEHAETKSHTQEILEVLDAAKGGFKVLGVMATFLKYLTMIGAFCLFVWSLFHPSDDIKHLK